MESVLEKYYPGAEVLDKGFFSVVLSLNPLQVAKLSLKNQEHYSLQREHQLLKQAGGLFSPKVYAFKDFAECQSLQMERLGQSLSQKHLDIVQLRKVAHGLISALRHLHELGLVHRDLKPQNACFTLNETSDCIIKIVDFGLVARISELDKLSQQEELIGSLCYCSPYLEPGRPFTLLDDYWSLYYTLAAVAGLPRSHFLPWRHLIKSSQSLTERFYLAKLIKLKATPLQICGPDAPPFILGMGRLLTDWQNQNCLPNPQLLQQLIQKDIKDDESCLVDLRNAGLPVSSKDCSLQLLDSESNLTPTTKARLRVHSIICMGQ